MPSTGTAELTLPSEKEILFTREFDAGTEVAFHGVFREIVANERIVNTEVYEAMPDGEALVTVTFAEEEGRTRMEMLTEMESKEAREGLLESGMESGLQEGLDLIERIAIELAGAEG